MKKLTYSDGQTVRLNDRFTAPRWGTCIVKSFDRLNACAVAENTCTGEVFDMLGQPTFGESDLIARAHKAPSREELIATIRKLRFFVIGAGIHFPDCFREANELAESTGKILNRCNP